MKEKKEERKISHRDKMIGGKQGLVTTKAYITPHYRTLHRHKLLNDELILSSLSKFHCI